MAYSLAAAAEATGLNKTMVLRAIKTGKISGIRNESGEWHVEPAELHRVYPSLPRQRAPRIRRRAAMIDCEMRARPSSTELGIWALRERWQLQAEHPVTGALANRGAKPWWRRLADYLESFLWPPNWRA
jgi:hypothetical protein